MALIRPIPTSSNIDSNTMFACGTNTSDVNFTSGTGVSTGLSGTVDATYLVNTKGFSSLAIQSNNYTTITGGKFLNGSKTGNISSSSLTEHSINISNTDFIVLHITGVSINFLNATFS